MKDLFYNVTAKMYSVLFFLLMVVPMIIVLSHFNINGFISTLISLAYYYIFRHIPYLMPIVLIASFIIVFIDFSIKVFIGYCAFFIIITLLVFMPWILAIRNYDKDKDESN